MESIIFRPAKKEDGPAVLALVKESLAYYGLKINPEETDKDLLDIPTYYRGGCFTVVEDNAAIIGSFGIYRLSKELCELRKMYLHRRFHGRGLGKEMLNRALEQARALGYVEMHLESNQLLVEANALYRKAGFSHLEAQHLSDRCDYAMKMVL